MTTPDLVMKTTTKPVTTSTDTSSIPLYPKRNIESNIVHTDIKLCIGCDNPIASARLRVNPSTNHCIVCATTYEEINNLRHRFGQIR